ncbi:S1/P1 nuclease [Bradyrhizobium sp. CCGUVB1N3]|uniref:S1/P1 nuclease n=1 Tax=Bradyrhizobium sp. CCGUVB1N3 TaxID=2949629 RepID=UPI0020B1E558|nr:S1/P1 nuclease [Bradyrhizobium sp. CCGUVB1N3]MCP3475837.1 S1/P1 nuclease [Bradyrhizobium sp. CCGUVB1N3]
MKIRFLIALGCAVLFGSSANAWNNFGHMEAAALAWSQLTPAAKQEATRLLKLNPQYDGWIQGVPASQRDQVAFVKAATWPDQIKSLSDYHNDGDRNGDVAPQTPEASQNIGYADHFRHKYWHFIDEPFSTDGTPLQQAQSPNAQTQVAVFKKTLADKTASDDVRSYDLSWLLHLIGDLHQPLHATSRFTHAEQDGDAGGNDVKISCTKCGSARELHAFWDGLLGPTSAPPQDAIDAAADLRIVDSGSTDENDWIQESFEIAKSSVYAPPIRGGDGPYKLTQAYQSRAHRIANQRIALAGARIAAILNDAFK